MGLLTSKLGGLVPSEARNGNFQVPPTIVVSDTDPRFVMFAAEKEIRARLWKTGVSFVTYLRLIVLGS